MTRVGLVSIALLAASACSSSSSNSDMAGVDMAGGAKIKVGGQAIAPELAFSQISIALGAGMTPMPNPLVSGEFVVPENDKTQAVTAGVAGAWGFTATANTTVTPYAKESAKLLPSISDAVPVGTTEIQGIPAHLVMKTGKEATTLVLGTAGGPTQAALLAQGACFVDVLASHDPDPIPAAATIAVTEAGYDVYSLSWNATGQAVAAKSLDGGMTGRFLITKNGNTTAGKITLMATDKGGKLTFESKSCRIEPGAITFFPYERKK